MEMATWLRLLPKRFASWRRPRPRPRRGARFSLSLGRVALLGIAQRQIQAKFPANLGNQKRANALKLNIKSAGDWLKVKRLEKNLTPGQVAARMGIATSLVCSWEGNTQQPDNQQLKVLASVLDFDAKDFEKVINTP